ncbi:hypothetical protein BJX68DRAFT_242599 [Aspergillus pseudodeflectus]|uniref:Uncharacterized protein n=1 Tax=Aspergillus pseudodeflectus TaxID=176178 RepID=A0ABR4JY13_9EURO
MMKKRGQVKMTADAIHPAARSYLTRKGFVNDEDVRRRWYNEARMVLFGVGELRHEMGCLWRS